ncbi:MAG: DUF4426 domain-containing protein [Pseudomonadales bacterium]|nr:DUF4426 domain-containing protein [Pseudomonadales bacterium]
MKQFKYRFLSTLMLLLSASLQAEQAQDFGAYTVHYIAVNSTFLDPEIARQYGITRSERRGFVNISVLKNSADGNGPAVSAHIEGLKKNLLQQAQPLNFTEIREAQAIYYLGEFDFSNAETLRFELQIQPEARGPVYPLTWTTRLYSD